MRPLHHRMRPSTLRTHWFKSPFEHWVSGLLTEIATFGGFLILVWLGALLLIWVL